MSTFYLSQVFQKKIDLNWIEFKKHSKNSNSCENLPAACSLVSPPAVSSPVKFQRQVHCNWWHLQECTAAVSVSAKLCWAIEIQCGVQAGFAVQFLVSIIVQKLLFWHINRSVDHLNQRWKALLRKIDSILSGSVWLILITKELLDPSKLASLFVHVHIFIMKIDSYCRTLHILTR